MDTYQNDNLVLLANMALISNFEANKSFVSNKHEFELQKSYNIETPSLKSQCNTVTNESKKSH
ncbi:hypothetical protein THOM_2905 [Trachipleistophora hominis]|uniref:Uncharacterized protein n=1 Tax=Trachipleistophora hominis TaxID=72359 RepID=L7JTW2_TRAHO|nr:hypothetical protein THOM_2905 [Trachipleistophora hominis]